MNTVIRFLLVDEILATHERLINEHGGSHGVRDHGLLESALAAPESGFGDSYFHEDIFEMAAAYAFHIIKNHPFIDGNKRTGTAAFLIFLDYNGIEVELDDDALIDLALKVATSAMDKKQIAAFLKKHVIAH